MSHEYFLVESGCDLEKKFQVQDFERYGKNMSIKMVGPLL